MLRKGVDLLESPVLGAFFPKCDGSFVDRLRRIGNDFSLVDFEQHAESGTTRTRAVRRVEGEESRRDLADGDAAVRTGVALGEELFVLAKRIPRLAPLARDDTLAKRIPRLAPLARDDTLAKRIPRLAPLARDDTLAKRIFRLAALARDDTDFACHPASRRGRGIPFADATRFVLASGFLAVCAARNDTRCILVANLHQTLRDARGRLQRIGQSLGDSFLHDDAVDAYVDR